jgi:uncharacterized protein (DUF1697 family)/GNAT superfamily N-acetyltransferase
MEPGYNPYKSDRQGISGQITFESLSKANWDKFVTLFGQRGACGNCWCMAYRLKKSDFDAGKHNEGNKKRMKQLVWKNQPTGILGMYKGQAISWCAFAPREVILRLENSRVHKRIDERAVWSIPCFFIEKRFRKQGLSVQILKGVIDYARKNNIEIIEAYPVIPTTEKLPDPFVWAGLFRSFAKAGFQVADNTSKSRPMVRYYTNPSTRYVAFLRGINVGGKKIIKMEELNKIFTSAGFLKVRTLIQSGNVIFNSTSGQIAKLNKEIADLIRKNLGFDVEVFVKSLQELKEIFLSDPFAERKSTGRSKLYLSLLSSPPSKKPYLPFFSEKKDVEIFRIDHDMAFIITHEINGRYGFPNNFFEETLGVTATTRNWNTIEKLVKEQT